MQAIRGFDLVIHSLQYTQDRTKVPGSDVDKLEQAIDVHGYRGASKKKHNGVVCIRPSDVKLWKVYNNNVGSCTDLRNIDAELLTAVKVVAHCPNGNRGVGACYEHPTAGFVLVLLGMGNYGGKLAK